MQLVSTIVSALGDALVALTVILALWARRDARAAQNMAEVAREAYAEQQLAAQRETELVRRRQRVENVGEVTERLFWTLVPSAGGSSALPQAWMPDRNRIAQLVVGLAAALPSCAAIPEAGTPEHAFDLAKQGRNEVTEELQRIDRELRKLHSPAIPQAANATDLDGNENVADAAVPTTWPSDSLSAPPTS